MKHKYSAYWAPETGVDCGSIIIHKERPVWVGLQDVTFEVIFDSDLGMGYSVTVPWQRAGKFKRRTHHVATHLTYREGHYGKRPIKMRTSTDFIYGDPDLSPSDVNYLGGPRYHLFGSALSIVHVYGKEECKLAAKAAYQGGVDGRTPRLLDLAHTLSKGQVGRCFLRLPAKEEATNGV